MLQAGEKSWWKKETWVLLLDFNSNSSYILFALMLLTAGSVGSSNQRFYQNTNDASVYVDPDLEFNHGVVFSTSARVLSGSASDLDSGDVMCPGTVTIRNSISGVGASGSNFEAVSYGVVSCADPDF